MAGIEDANVIDLITHDPSSDEFVLIMCETRPWETDPNQIDQLISKINTYAAYVIDEAFLVDHPEAGERPIRIQIDCVDAPGAPTATVISEAASRLADYGIGLTVNPLGPPT